MLRAACLSVSVLAAPLAMAQSPPTAPQDVPNQLPIKGQDPETAMKGQGSTGWVQAPEARGLNAPTQTAQGAGASGKPQPEGGQVPPGENPGAPVTTALPNASGMAPQVPSK